VANSARWAGDLAYRASRGLLAAIVTLLSGVVIGELGFLRFAQETASANNTLMLEIAGRQASGVAGAQDVGVSAPVALTMLSSLTFALGTPLGWLATYLVVTGGVRCLAAAADERRGDPIVGLVRRLVARRLRMRREARAQVAYAALAGPEVADRLVSPERLGITGADLVVVTSRPKPDWTPGTVLECGDRWLAVGERMERSLPVGLRTLYPLVDMPETAVFRRIVPYELPPRVE
jgi:hypothetical protein